MDWLKAKAEEALKMKVQKESMNEKVDIEEIGPQCPNCQSSLLKAVAVEEQAARDQLANVMNLLTSGVDLQSESVAPIEAMAGDDEKDIEIIDP